MKPYWLPALLAPLFMALEVAMDLAQPRFLQTIVDEGLANGDLPLVLRTGWYMVVAGLIGLIGGVACTVFSTIAGLGFGADLRGMLFRKIQSFSFANIERLETGCLITRLTNDTDQVQEAMLMFLRILVRAPLLVVGSLIMAILTDPQLSLLLLFISPLLILILVVVSRRGHVLFLAVQDRLDRINTILQENLARVRVVKAFVCEGYEHRRFAVRNDDFMDQNIRAFTLVAIVMPSMMLLVNIGVVGVIWFGGWQVQAGQAQVGQLLAFINYLLQMLSSLMMVGMLVMRVAQADASAERINEVLHEVPGVRDLPQAVPFEPDRGSVQFDKVCFGYDGDGTEPALSEISLSVEPGETLAVVGATGSGKSTLMHLIPRFYDTTGGRVLVDCNDVRSLRQADLRRSAIMVLQETVLFSGTIRDNIRFGRPDADDAEIEQAARLAQAHDFIMTMPEGYDTMVSRRGANLSGGQKQRLAIARALVCRPAVLLLDDCTSALDAATEAALLDALAQSANTCTRIMVAQRISSVLQADRVLVLDDGAVAAVGTHRELLQTSAVYRDIVRSQTGESGEIADV